MTTLNQNDADAGRGARPGKPSFWHNLAHGTPFDGRLRNILNTLMLPPDVRAALQDGVVGGIGAEAKKADGAHASAQKLACGGHTPSTADSDGGRSPQSPQSTHAAPPLGGDTAPTGPEDTAAPQLRVLVSTGSTSDGCQGPLSASQQPPPLPCRIRTCMECKEPIEGSVFMLNDLPYCCQRHRLVAYHKGEQLRKQQGELYSLSGPTTPSPHETGLRQAYATWA